MNFLLLQVTTNLITGLPTSLPPHGVTADDLKRNTGLATVSPGHCKEGTALSLELLDFSAWLQDQFRSDRPEGFSALNPTSAANTRGSVLQYLGFLHLHHEEAHARLDLSTYRDFFGDGYMRYMAFNLAKGLAGSTLVNHGQVAHKVLAFVR